MTSEARQFILTTAWLFARHGSPRRAKHLMEALVEADPRDGVSAAVLAELMLNDGEADKALQVLRMAEFPEELARAQAVLETRALIMTGNKEDGQRRWKRYMESKKGAERIWV